jgi:mannose-6-phosphate isomerase-like protein (cupin superfamily)
MAIALGMGSALAADSTARVTEAVNHVYHGDSTEAATSPATTGTLVHDGEYLKTGPLSRAEMLLPSTSVTRLGANTIFNYSADSNTVDLQAGTILFCKPKDAPHLNIKTAAVTAGIVGTTGFVSIRTDQNNQKTYVFGLIEGEATVWADNHPFPIGAGDIVEFRPGSKPFVFAYDLPRFVKSSPLLHKFTGTLPNQAYIDRAVADYESYVSRGFIVPPSQAISYSGGIPVMPTTAYNSAMNSLGQPSKGGSPPPPPPQSSSPGNSSPGTGSYRTH